MELLVLVSVVLLLACVLRWSFGDGRGTRRGRRGRRDYGLLVEIATAPGRSVADMATDALRTAGIRATTAPADHPGHVAVLVFGTDSERARAVLLDEQWPRQQT